jgi:hypothetical protein
MAAFCIFTICDQSCQVDFGPLCIIFTSAKKSYRECRTRTVSRSVISVLVTLYISISVSYVSVVHFMYSIQTMNLVKKDRKHIYIYSTLNFLLFVQDHDRD